jgi:prepilin-type N-terminal cleavage/methylation domain-containing protein
MILAERKRSVLSEAGFTLLEMLIAVTLVAMMAVGLWAVFQISIRSWSRGTEFIDANQRHRSILSMVRKQIASTYCLFSPADLRQGKTPYLIFSGTENSLRFISLNSLRFQESPGLTLVSFDVAQDREGHYSLVEREERYLGQDPDLESFLNRGDEKVTTIFSNLLSLTLEYFDPGDNVNPAKWVREWDGQNMGRPPLAVSMTMISRDPEGNTLNRHMVVPIQAQSHDARMNFVNPFGGRRAVMR